jgi:hypothetical protein
MIRGSGIKCDLKTESGLSSISIVTGLGKSSIVVVVEVTSAVVVVVFSEQSEWHPRQELP